jgi:hypothetical protein
MFSPRPATEPSLVCAGRVASGLPLANRYSGVRLPPRLMSCACVNAAKTYNSGTKYRTVLYRFSAYPIYYQPFTCCCTVMPGGGGAPQFPPWSADLESRPAQFQTIWLLSDSAFCTRIAARVDSSSLVLTGLVKIARIPSRSALA